MKYLLLILLAGCSVFKGSDENLLAKKQLILLHQKAYNSKNKAYCYNFEQGKNKFPFCLQSIQKPKEEKKNDSGSQLKITK